MNRAYETFRLSWLAPHHWLLWIGIGAWFLIALLPKKIRKFFTALFEFVISFRKNSASGEIIKANLSLCFPAMTLKKQSLCINNYFRIISTVFIDYARYMIKPNYLDSLVTIHNQELITNALRDGKGIILLVCHTSSADMLLAYLLSNIPFPSIGIFQPAKREVVSWVLNKGRVAHSQLQLLPRGHRGIFLRAKSALTEGGIFCPLLDESIASKRSALTPFFGIPKHTVTWLPTIQKITDAALINFYGRYDLAQQHYHIDLTKMPKLQKNELLGSPSHLNRMYENAIKRSPENFIWQFKIFKNQGGKNYYS